MDTEGLLFRGVASFLYIKYTHFSKVCFFRKENSLKNVHGRTQISTISKSGFLEGLNDGKLKNVFFPKWKWSDLLTDLNYHGMAERIRWVPPPKSLLCVEIGPRFEGFGFLEILTNFRFFLFENLPDSRNFVKLHFCDPF